MELSFDTALAADYKSGSQRVRVMSEAWMQAFMYCPCCGEPRVERFANNKPVADFFCPVCGEEFELKSKRGALGAKIADGAYETAVRRITSNENPSLFVLQYDRSYQVRNLLLIPKFFFVESIVEKRKPLAATARRAGWEGCNFVISSVPQQGRLEIIKDGIEAEKATVIKRYQRCKALSTSDLSSRGWLLDVLNCVNEIKSVEFRLAEVYQFAKGLQGLHPDNHNVEAKIRQQLQLLRDKGYLEFVGKGVYRKI